jgi:hypothetical protein
MADTGTAVSVVTADAYAATFVPAEHIHRYSIVGRIVPTVSGVMRSSVSSMGASMGAIVALFGMSAMLFVRFFV